MTSTAPHILVIGSANVDFTVKVERLSPSGKWAYAMVYGDVNRHDWIDASVLTKKQ